MRYVRAVCRVSYRTLSDRVTEQLQEQFTQCRIDHYQTPSEVHASVFAKQADPATSSVKIEENEARAWIDL